MSDIVEGLLELEMNKSGRAACPRSRNSGGQATLPDLFYLLVYCRPKL